MIPGDPTGSPDEFFNMEKTLVLLDSGFLSKLSKHFGKGKYIEYDLMGFSKKNITKTKFTLQAHFLLYSTSFSERKTYKSRI